MFRLNGAFELRTDLGVLRHVEGDEIALRPKTYQTLLYLVRNRHRLVTKEELTSEFWPDTAVTDDALVQCIVELRKALGDAAREPRFIKTVPKLGYRFVGPVEEIQDEPTDAIAQADAVVLPESSAPPRRVAFWPIPVAVGAAALIAAVVVFTNLGTPTETASLDPTSSKPGIAVMFLDNQSKNEDVDWMRQGLAEMLITGLSRSERVNVLGRKHLQTLLERAGHPLDREITLDAARDVARRAQAQYLLMGSFVRLGDKTRIDVRMEGVDAKQVASETLTVDRPEDVLTQVDLLAWKLATYFDQGVQPPTDVAASGLTTNLDAYRAYTLGVSKAIAYHSEEAVQLFQRALELDPNFVMARARLGYVYGVTWPHGTTALPYLEAAFKEVDHLRESDRLYIESWYAMARNDFPAAIPPMQRLVRLYPYEIEAHNRLARLLLGEKRHDEALDVARRGLVVDPESTDLHNTLGGLYHHTGRLHDAVSAHQRYVALAPDEPNSHDSLGLSLQIAGRYAEAEAAYAKALALKPDFKVALAHQANVYFQTGRYRQAEMLYERYASLSITSFERARARTAMVTIQVRHGRLDEGRASAVAADKENHRSDPTLPPWGMLTWSALTGRPLESMPTRVQFAAWSDRGQRASRRYFFWLEGRDALARGNVPAGLDFMRESLLENNIYWGIDPYDDGLAQTYFELRRWDEAIAEFGKVLKANPRYPRAHYFLALAYEKKGQAAEARKALEEFLTIWSGADADIPEVIDARARLARLTN
jgi:tetratricopeptide (TPR) repeat protein/DNA-binding winged helix-turn-helix (wHTH) protein